jgi:hypothetical protein
VSTWPKARPPVDPASAAMLAELDQIMSAFRDLGRPFEVEHARYTAESVRMYGVDTVSDIRLRLLRKVLAAAEAG